MRKESGDPPLDHSCSLLPLTDPVTDFNSDIDPHRSRLRGLVDVKVLVVMDVNLTENDGIATACHLHRRFWTTGDWWRRNHDSGHDHINGCL